MDTESLYESALDDFKKGFTMRGESRLRLAADANHALAQLSLAQLYVKRSGPRAGNDPQIARLLAGAISNDCAEAMFFKSVLDYSVGEKSSALDHLNSSAARGFPPAQTALGLAWLEHDDQESRTLGKAWLLQASRNGDKAAMALEKTGYLKAEDAKGPYPELPSWADTKNILEWDRLSDAPTIRYADHIFSDIECNWLRMAARRQLRNSFIVDPATKRPRLDPIRTSTGMNFGLPCNHITAARMVDRISALAGSNMARAEPFAVLRYVPGQEYKPHPDAFGPQAIQNDPLRNSGDRDITALIYLNTPIEGGETVFPLLDISVKANMGRLLVFHNMDSEGNPEKNALHAGMPIVTGSKWIGSLWLREAPILNSFPG